MFIKLDREYEVKCTLGTIRDIERAFDKGYFELMENMSKMTTDDAVKMLFAGVRRANPELTAERFSALCEDCLGVGDLMEYLEKYLYALQYPGLSDEEVQRKIQKKLQRTQALRNP